MAAARDGSPFSEPYEIAKIADRLGFGEVWAGEGPTWDCFALATAIGLSTKQIDITAGPLPVSVRDPASIVRGAASAAFLTGRRIGVALGASSRRVVEGFHEVSRARVASVLEETSREIRSRLTGSTTGGDRSARHGFDRVLPPPAGLLTVAAFGDRAISVAARFADRMVLDLVTPEQVATLRKKLVDAARESDRTPPCLAAWLPAAVDPESGAEDQINSSIVGYLTVPGYSDMFEAAGFGEAVEQARDGEKQASLLGFLPKGAASRVGLVGSLAQVRDRLDAYAAAGLDEVAIVPATAGDPSGERTMTALTSLL
ncbi:LLM class F420-dependent oxidoreductase [soil metagenome]